MHVDLFVDPDQPTDLLRGFQGKVGESHQLLPLQFQLIPADGPAVIDHIHFPPDTRQFDDHHTRHCSISLELVERNKMDLQIGVFIHLEHLPEISGDELLVTVEPLDVDRQMAVGENEFPAQVVAHMLKGIGTKVFKHIAGELIDVGAPVDRQCAVPFYHPVSVNTALLERTETDQYENQKESHNLS